jgi:hypothetical protein
MPRPRSDSAQVSGARKISFLRQLIYSSPTGQDYFGIARTMTMHKPENKTASLIAIFFF